MKLIVGLGNPGKEFVKTRHNVGFMVIDEIITSLQVNMHEVKKYFAMVYYLQNKKVLFVKPNTFMNDSGKTVKIITDQYKVKDSDLIIVHDDLDIKLGELKIQGGKGPKDHNGILSIEETLGKKDFIRVRIGVDNRESDNRLEGKEYVLRNFEKEELDIVDSIIKETAGVIKEKYVSN